MAYFTLFDSTHGKGYEELGEWELYDVVTVVFIRQKHFKT